MSDHQLEETSKPESQKMPNFYRAQPTYYLTTKDIQLLLRESPDAKAFAERIEKQHNKARANTLLAVKLGRAVYWMLTRKTAFDAKIFTK